MQQALSEQLQLSTQTAQIKDQVYRSEENALQLRYDTILSTHLDEMQQQQVEHHSTINPILLLYICMSSRLDFIVRDGGAVLARSARDNTGGVGPDTAVSHILYHLSCLVS